MAKKTTPLILSLVLALGLLLFTTGVQAQEDAPYRVSLRRDFGYGSGTNVQGSMTLRLVGDEDQVAWAEFFMDGDLLARVESAPFSFSFSTDSYPAGGHQLTAELETVDGQSFTTKAITYRFLSKEEAQGSMKGILIPIVVIMALVLGVSLLIQYVPNKNKTGKPTYGGYYGGAVCKQCAQPFQRSVFGMNMVIGRLERCPHCGKWQFTQRTSPQVIASAEQAAQEKFQPEESASEPEISTEDVFEDTKYTDQI